MTYSIIARDPESHEIGIAVASRFFACGAAVPYIGRRVAVATQAFVNPLWGTEGRRMLESGDPAEALLKEFAARDAGRDIRQCHMLDAEGNFAAHTGAGCVDWAGHRVGSTHSVAGNMLTGPEVVEATFDTYAARRDLPMAERLLAAMRAGEEAGGDVRALSLIHATRVLVIVTVAPLIMRIYWGVDLARPPGASIAGYSASQIALMVAAGFLGWKLAERAGLFGASILGPLIGALIVGVFNSGLRLAGVDVLWQLFATGWLIIVAVAVDQWIRKISS